MYQGNGKENIKYMRKIFNENKMNLTNGNKYLRGWSEATFLVFFNP